jgi:hypothetical protein
LRIEKVYDEILHYVQDDKRMRSFVPSVLKDDNTHSHSEAKPKNLNSPLLLSRSSTLLLFLLRSFTKFTLSNAEVFRMTNGVQDDREIANSHFSH